ncbi:sensor histidine kinase [Lentibacillus cibarius]|uniref:sensor histidine kinase n=1 Tax=Lentibacillus cibarius TaxID=2583219 RepID=UPI001F45E586|nr:HAMP domain-containing sensor histidine kinase [Lentibacillus cibarius]
MVKRILSLLPKGFLWRLSALNIVMIASVILLSGLATYYTACSLVGAISDFNSQQQSLFNQTLFNYLLIFAIMTFILGSLLHFYSTKKLIKPIRNLIEATMQLKKGKYPEPTAETAHGEVGELVTHFNGLIRQLEANEETRRKMISDLSHELRTPLTNLNGYLQALRDGDMQGSQALYEALHKETKHLMDLTEQMEMLKEWGDMSSRIYTEYNNVDVAELIKQCTAVFQWKLEREHLDIYVHAESCEMSVHAKGIRQVINNLIENAIHYHKGENENTIRLEGKVEYGYYHLSVSGPSERIPAEDQERIFERFYRSNDARNRQYGGSGLGLAIAKEIIEQHNGRIGLTTNERYNTFWFTLPISSIEGAN